mgnify:FL=1
MAEDKANIHTLLKKGDVYCQNCGRVSHCGNALTLALIPELMDANQVEVCKFCRCDNCKSDIWKREHISDFYAGDGTYIHCPNGKPDRIEDDGTLTYYQK